MQKCIARTDPGGQLNAGSACIMVLIRRTASNTNAFTTAYLDTGLNILDMYR